MSRMNVSLVIASVAFFFAASMSAPAQVGEMRGHVLIKQADGSSLPVADAVIDVFRTDIGGKYNTKTNKNGEFVFAGLPYIGTYVLAASAPNAEPNFIKGIRAGQGTDYELVLAPGNGKRLTIDDIKAAGATAPTTGGGTGRESAADRARREELIKKNKEIEETNKKNTNINEVVKRTFVAGNEALKAKNYDEAIKQYDEGIAADAQPALLTNKSVALRMRAVERYNAAIQNKDDAAQRSGIEAAKKDFKDSADTAKQALDAIKAEPAATTPADQARQATNKLSALNVLAESMRLYVTKADQTQVDAGYAAYQEYIAAETDPARKSTAELNEAQMLFEAGASDKAAAEYQKILAKNPDNVDALVGAGLSIINIGYAANDKAKLQEGVNYLQRFVDKAPDTHKLKADARATIEELKKQQVAPQKTGTARRHE